jgi:hypothetical protein
MQRIWDIIVGSFMILVGLAVGVVIAGLIAIPVIVALPEEVGKKTWIGYAVGAGILVILNAASFYDVYRRRRANMVYGSSGIIHLVPRGVRLIMTGDDSWQRA